MTSVEEFTIEVGDTLDARVIEAHRGTIQRFLEGPYDQSNTYGYLTVDLGNTTEITQDGLEAIARLAVAVDVAYKKYQARKLDSYEGPRLQFVNVSKEQYIQLMNTGIEEEKKEETIRKRLIMYAEIYTNRTSDNLNSYMLGLTRLGRSRDLLGLEYWRNGNWRGSSAALFRELHGPENGHPITEEGMRNQNEYMLIYAIRDIEDYQSRKEEGRPIIAHLGYEEYGTAAREKIEPLSELPHVFKPN